MNFRFVDLFAGIGGLRIAFEKAGGECVFSSEYDKYSQETYKAFFGEKPIFDQIVSANPPGDITQISPNQIPDHDILTAGFPCQPFSLAGVSKKQSLGRPHGFDDPTQGTLFFNVKEIIRAKRPEAFLLENVKNLKSHDEGRTFEVIKTELRKLDYQIEYGVIDAAQWTPQHRQRIFIAGFRKPESTVDQSWEVAEGQFDLSSIVPSNKKQDLEDILEAHVDPKYTLGPGTWNTLVRHKKHHQEKGQGFGYGMIYPPFNGTITRTLSARYHKDGAEILIHQGDNERPRRLTPLECCRLMGFPREFQRFFDPKDNEKPQPVSDTQAYRQFGNSVSVPVVTDIAKALCNTLKKAKLAG
jgi:DNA (cytosine-5)-methyltransferase 1